MKFLHCPAVPYQAFVTKDSKGSSAHIWAAESEVDNAQWIPPVTFALQNYKCRILTLMLVDIDWIYILGNRLVMPDVCVPVLRGSQVFAIVIAFGHDVSEVLHTSKHNNKVIVKSSSVKVYGISSTSATPLFWIRCHQLCVQLTTNARQGKVLPSQ